MSDSDVKKLLTHIDVLFERLEPLLPKPAPTINWQASVAFRWRNVSGPSGRGTLEPVRHVHKIKLQDLYGIDRQKKIVEQNTRQFIAGHPANNVLLTGARGTGKSSLVKALLNKYASKGLRIVEVEKEHLVDLPEIVAVIGERPERFILYCDDLSFAADESGYKALKVVLDGSVAAASENCLIYATSNRRHLMPESMSENLETKRIDDEIHPGETVEEKISLSERFGIWVSFYPFSQDEYLSIVAVWLHHFQIAEPESPVVRQAALQWALGRGSRSGRVAWQFARDWAGRMHMTRNK